MKTFTNVSTVISPTRSQTCLKHNRICKNASYINKLNVDENIKDDALDGRVQRYIAKNEKTKFFSKKNNVKKYKKLNIEWNDIEEEKFRLCKSVIKQRSPGVMKNIIIEMES